MAENKPAVGSLFLVDVRAHATFPSSPHRDKFGFRPILAYGSRGSSLIVTGMYVSVGTADIHPRTQPPQSLPCLVESRVRALDQADETEGHPLGRGTITGVVFGPHAKVRMERQDVFLAFERKISRQRDVLRATHLSQAERCDLECGPFMLPSGLTEKRKSGPPARPLGAQRDRMACQAGLEHRGEELALPFRRWDWRSS